MAAVVNATSAPMAVFDADGACLAANRAFVLDAAGHDPGWLQQSGDRAAFSPDEHRTWTVVTPSGAGGQRRALDMVDAVVNALPVMFNAKDLNSRYLFMNRYQAALYGVTPEGAVGRTAADLLGPSYGSYTRSRDAEVIASGKPVAFYEENYAGVDGVMRHWLTTKVPLLAADNAVWGVATVALDITERKELEERLRQAKDQAESGSRAKSRFLAAMSHELRTPLNAVIGFAELMEQEALGPLGNPDYVEYSGHILRSGMALLQMITNLLDFARVEAGTLTLRIASVELQRLLRSVVSGAGANDPALAGKPVTITQDMPGQPVVVRGDETRLRQVLGGLINNALKFTPADGEVGVKLRPLDDGALIEVTDTGIGMSDDEMRHVFEPFWQADSGLARVRGGAGIGLRLARELIALHGGTLDLDSRKGGGTRVTVRLPLDPPPSVPGD